MTTTTDGTTLTGAARETYVTGMFDRIASGYDRLNRIISLGRDQPLRRAAIQMAGVKPGMRVADLGTGTGDLYVMLQETVGPTGQVVGIDLADNMLEVARKKAAVKLPDRTHELRQGGADATGLPDQWADVVTMGWVLRNVGDRQAVYREVRRILKPGGRFVCIDMSTPDFAPLRWGANFYLNYIMPVAATLVGADRTAYVYLAKSTAKFPRKQELADEWKAAGFHDVQFRSYMGGGIGIHAASV
ncbi:MAG TPA: ubiquinone/menaquinone biosynthesis methyltransferase [Pirellulales bacterium]